MERGRIPRELPEQLREMMTNPSRECYPYAMIACSPLLMKETVTDRKKRFFCTSCGETFTVEQRQTVCDELAYELYYAKHEAKGECMRCGAEAAVIEGKRWNLARHGWYAPLVIRVQLDGYRQALLCFEVRRKICYVDGYGFCQDLALAKEDVYLLDKGAAGHYKYSWYHQGFNRFKVIDANGSDIRGGFGAPLSCHTASTAYMSYVVHDIGEWDTGRDILTYMPDGMISGWDYCVAAATYAVYPQTEMLWKAGYTDIVKKFMLDGKKCAAICRLDGDSMKKVFPKFSKEELRLLREKKLTDVQDMELYVKLKKVYGKRIPQAMEALEGLCSHYWDRGEVLATAQKAGVEPHRLYRYLNKIVEAGKAKKKPQVWETYITNAFGHWKDYIDAAAEIGFDLGREEVALPKKLGQRHDVAVKLHRELLAEQQAVVMAHIWENNEARYGYTDGEYVIVNPRSSIEIVDEGTAQCHCVAGYADRHAKGVLAIVFIRRVGEEDKALITVEMREDKLWQARKKHNRNPDEHEQEFIDKWLLEVKERFHPKKKTNKRKENTAVAVGVGA